MLELKNVSLSYREGKRVFFALQNINLKLSTGQCMAVVGKSGCGKSTLLNIMAGIQKPSSGKVIYNERDLLTPSAEISMIFQNYGIFPWKTVKDNMTLPLKIRKQKYDEARLYEVALQLHIKEQLNKYPCQLSGGQLQRVAIGRAMLNEAKLLLLDEPFSALDPMTRERLQIELKSMFIKQNITSVIVTHNIDEAVYWGDYIAVFSNEGSEISKVIDCSGMDKKKLKMIIKEHFVEK